MKLKLILLVTAFFTLFSACHKDKKVNPNVTVPDRTGLFVLNSGTTGKGSSLTFYDYTSKQLVPDIYASVNGSTLGDGASDMEVYGSKMYIITNSGLLILDVKTAKLVKKSSLAGGTITFYNKDVFIGNPPFIFLTDTTKLIASGDTALSNSIQLIKIDYGALSQMLVSNNKLYVIQVGVNGGLNNFGGTTLEVVDLSTMTVKKTINVIGNAYSSSADAYGNLYVMAGQNYISTGVYGPGGLTIIDNNADTVKSYQNINLTGCVYVQGDFVYYPTPDNKITMFNAKTQTVERSNFIADGTAITQPYAISGNPATGEIFISDIKDGVSNGELFAFDSTGNKEYSFTTGINPNKK